MTTGPQPLESCSSVQRFVSVEERVEGVESAFVGNTYAEHAQWHRAQIEAARDAKDTRRHVYKSVLAGVILAAVLFAAGAIWKVLLMGPK